MSILLQAPTSSRLPPILLYTMISNAEDLTAMVKQSLLNKGLQVLSLLEAL